MNFNKEEFAILLQRAKGNRTITKYSNDSGVSISHISRLLRGLLDTAPSTELISKLSSSAYDGVSYKDLLEAAGHIEVQKTSGSVNEEAEIYSPFISKKIITEYENKVIQIILSYLQKQEYDWSIQKSNMNSSRSDMIVTVDNNEDSFNWYIDFKMTLSDHRHLPPYNIYGLVTTLDLKPNDKYTIAVNTEKYYKSFTNNIPKLLKANLYVMLIDLDEGQVVKEEQLSEYK